MAFLVTLTYRKPDPSILWHSQYFRDMGNAENFVSYTHVQQEYGLYDRRTFNELDPLTLEISHIWESEEQWNEYLNHSAVRAMQELFEMYNFSKGITREISTRTI